MIYFLQQVRRTPWIFPYSSISPDSNTGEVLNYGNMRIHEGAQAKENSAQNWGKVCQNPSFSGLRVKTGQHYHSLGSNQFGILHVLTVTILHLGGDLVCQLLNCVQLFATPQTIALRAPLSMNFSRQENRSGQPLPSPGVLTTQGSNPALPLCRQILYHLIHK